jgi:hypothetical protein
MMLIPAGVKVHLALGYTDLRKGIDGLGVMVERVLEQDPFSGHLFVFRGKRADLIKVLFWDRAVPVHEAPGIRPIRLAGNERARALGCGHGSAAVDAAGGARLAPARAGMAACRRWLK